MNKIVIQIAIQKARHSLAIHLIQNTKVLGLFVTTQCRILTEILSLVKLCERSELVYISQLFSFIFPNLTSSRRIELSKTKVRLKNLKNDSSILSRKVGQKWPCFGENPTVCLLTSPLKALQRCMPPPVTNLSPASWIEGGQVGCPFFKSRSTVVCVQGQLHSSGKVLSLRVGKPSPALVSLKAVLETRTSQKYKLQQTLLIMWSKLPVLSHSV